MTDKQQKHPMRTVLKSTKVQDTDEHRSDGAREGLRPLQSPEYDEEPNQVTASKKKSGRPAYYPPWLKPAAMLVANGYTLRRALWRLGVTIPEKQLRQVYRWKLFRQFYEEARRVFVADWGSTPPRKVESFTRSVLGQWVDLNLNASDE